MISPGDLIQVNKAMPCWGNSKTFKAGIYEAKSVYPYVEDVYIHFTINSEIFVTLAYDCELVFSK